jgi:hypothetical protein
MKNNMHDELLTAYLDIKHVRSEFDANLHLDFIGLENFHLYRKGGRLEIYKASLKLSKQAFSILAEIIFKSAQHLQQLDQ